MSVYNSSVGSNQDDSDITIINPSIIHEHHDEYVNNTYVPIVTRLRQANHSSETRQTTNSQASITTPITTTIHHTSTGENSYSKNDYIFVDHNPQENAEQLEQVLTFYVRDLKQESQSQLDCDRQLVTRLMDLIRPAYPHDQKKMIALDKLMGEIASLHDKRHIEHKEKLEQLRTEICQLNKMLCSARDEQSICNDASRNYSAMNSIRRDSIHDYDQWTEIEDDAKKLHQIVQTQKNQINEIVALISESATAVSSLNPTDASVGDAEETASEPKTPSVGGNDFISSLLKRIHLITREQEPTVIDPPQTQTLENHSPGASPSQSLATLTLTSMNPTTENQTQETERAPEPQVPLEEPVREQPHHSIDVPLTPTHTAEPRRCPVCNHQFDPTLEDADMYDHIDRCLFPSMPQAEPQDYECPECRRKWPANDEIGYHQHLSDCFNRVF